MVNTNKGINNNRYITDQTLQFNYFTCYLEINVLKLLYSLLKKYCNEITLIFE